MQAERGTPVPVTQLGGMRPAQQPSGATPSAATTATSGDSRPLGGGASRAAAAAKPAVIKLRVTTGAPQANVPGGTSGAGGKVRGRGTGALCARTRGARELTVPVLTCAQR